MATPAQTMSVESQLEQWRTYLRRRQAIRPVDVAELEDHLRAQMDALVRSGLDADEAFLVAMKRMGSLDALSREFAREHSERLWKQLVVGASEDDVRPGAGREAMLAFALAIAAAALLKLPQFFGYALQAHADFYARNASFFVLPPLVIYFVWKRGLGGGSVRWIGAAFIAAAVVANAYTFGPESATLRLMVLHLPIALWLVAGVAYAGARWTQVAGRMDFIRFSGELFIYYVLIALGGGVFTAFLAMIFQAIGVRVDTLIESWLLPCGAAGAVIVASWLVEAKQGVIENMAPVLTRLFTPFFAILLLAFVGTVLFTGRGIQVERNVLIAFDALLAVVLGLLLYSMSARDPRAAPTAFDALQVVLLLSALAADALALWAIAARIHDFGFTPNRTAALGENLILLANLAWSAVLYVRFLRGRAAFGELEAWQTRYLRVYAAWAALVVVAFPPLFGFA